MNIYIVVEGAVGEKLLYQDWIPLVNNNLVYAATINDVRNNNFFIQIGGGYPNYLQVIKDAITDVRSIKKDGNDTEPLFNRLVIVADSENMTYDEKKFEIESLVEENIAGEIFDYKLIIQHFCMETWGLANRRLVSNNIQDAELKNYVALFNVATNDPELLPDMPQEELNRAQFAYKYLRLLLRNKFKSLSYTKSNPAPLLHPRYFEEVKNRFDNTGHVNSFGNFLDAFV